MKRFVIGVAAATISWGCAAEFYSGNRLLEKMRGDHTEQMVALGYVMGVADALNGVISCPPNGVTAGQLSDLVRAHLERAPEVRHMTADVLISAAMRATWPCANRNSNNNRSVM